MGDAEHPKTRERILQAALDLFRDRGYEATSLREIAQAVGVTKAALYYYFPSKEAMIRALSERFFEGTDAFFARLEETGAGTASWRAAVEQFVDFAFAQRDLFAMMDRNRATFEKVFAAEHEGAHARMDQLQHFMSNPSLPLEQRIRVSAVIGMVMLTVIGSGSAFADNDSARVRQMILDIARHILDEAPATT
jgi:AcrR family transcriptional regulator